jgi:hypothetical protein
MRNQAKYNAKNVGKNLVISGIFTNFAMSKQGHQRVPVRAAEAAVRGEGGYAAVRYMPSYPTR